MGLEATLGKAQQGASFWAKFGPVWIMMCPDWPNSDFKWALGGAKPDMAQILGLSLAQPSGAYDGPGLG